VGATLVPGYPGRKRVGRLKITRRWEVWGTPAGGDWKGEIVGSGDWYEKGEDLGGEHRAEGSVDS